MCSFCFYTIQTTLSWYLENIYYILPNDNTLSYPYYYTFRSPFQKKKCYMYYFECCSCRTRVRNSRLTTWKIFSFYLLLTITLTRLSLKTSSNFSFMVCKIENKFHACNGKTDITYWQHFLSFHPIDERKV